MTPQTVPVTVFHHVHHHHSTPILSNEPTEVQNMTFWGSGWNKMYETSVMLVTTSKKSLQVVMNVIHLIMGHVKKAMNQISGFISRIGANTKVF